MNRTRLLAVLLLQPVLAFAGDGDRRLAFAWAEPVAAVRCDLREEEQAAHAFAGAVERQDVGTACIVQIPRKRFDALYRFCTVDHVESLPREHYACFVLYSGASVTFHFSYSSDAFGAPRCAFVCTARRP